MNSVAMEERLAKLAEGLRRPESAEELTSGLVRQAAKLVVEQLLNAEVDEQLGRTRYARRPASPAGEVRATEPQEPEARGSSGSPEAAPFSGYRNGVKPRQLRTAEGKIPIDLPQVRAADGWASALWPKLRQRSEVLDKLVVEMYARGLSTRDIEDLLGEIDDGDAAAVLSKSSVSRITEVLWEEFNAFAQRDLSGLDVVYLFCDAVYESLRQQAGCKEAVLVTWGVLVDGSKALVHVSLGQKESQASWLDHFRSLIQRGLPHPLTVTTDGAPGCIAAIESTWPAAERIRCWVHKMKNVLEKVPIDQHEEIKRLLGDVRDAPNHPAGEQRAAALLADLEGRGLHSAARCLADDLPASLAHLKLPGRHRKAVRTTNVCERSFVEQRRRAKVLPRFRGERECLKLVFASLWRASERWKKVKFTPLERAELERYIAGRLADGFEVRSLVPAA